MLAVGLGIVFGGYLTSWWGYQLMKHWGLSVLDLAVPGYYATHGAVAPAGTIVVPDNQAPTYRYGQPTGKVINPQTGLTAPPPGWVYNPKTNTMEYTGK